jgi:hypothetical protein
MTISTCIWLLPNYALSVNWKTRISGLKQNYNSTTSLLARFCDVTTITAKLQGALIKFQTMHSWNALNDGATAGLAVWSPKETTVAMLIRGKVLLLLWRNKLSLETDCTCSWCIADSTKHVLFSCNIWHCNYLLIYSHT